MIKCPLCKEELSFEGEPYTKDAFPWLDGAPAIFRCRKCKRDYIYCSFPKHSILSDKPILFDWKHFKGMSRILNFCRNKEV